MELQHERRRKRELERAQAERLKRRYDAAWDKFIAAFNRHWDTCCKASFDPNQPRVPAGNPDGGQWRSGGGDAGAGVGVDRGKPGGINNPRVLSDATPGNDWIPGAQYAKNDRSHHPVDLSENTHVMQQHVRSPDYVLRRVREIARRAEELGDDFEGLRASSFSSLEAANKLDPPLLRTKL